MPKGFPKNGINKGWFKKGNPYNSIWYGKNRPEISNEKHPLWKGEETGYSPKHQWIARHKGKPMICENKNCPGKSKTFHWASISRKCKRVFRDWIRLCVSCHKNYDLGNIKLKIKK